MDEDKIVFAMAISLYKKTIHRLWIALIIALIVCGVSVVSTIYLLYNHRSSSTASITAITTAYIGKAVRGTHNKATEVSTANKAVVA